MTGTAPRGGGGNPNADLDEEAAKQLKPEMSLAEEKDQERKRWQALRNKDTNEFEAAQKEMETARKATSAVKAVATQGVKKRELPKIMQVKRKGDAVAEEAAPAEKRPKTEEAVAEPQPAVAEVKAAEEDAGGGGLLGAYGSDSEEDEEDE